MADAPVAAGTYCHWSGREAALRCDRPRVTTRCAMRFLRYALPVFVVALASASSANGAGLLIPEDKKLPPLAMVNHKVTVTIDEQVAVTTVEQTFRNHTARNLEAPSLFPVPKAATVTSSPCGWTAKKWAANCSTPSAPTRST